MQVVKMGLQLYRTPRGLLLLDLHKLFGSTFLFLDLCARITHELRLAPVPYTTMSSI